MRSLRLLRLWTLAPAIALVLVAAGPAMAQGPDGTATMSPPPPIEDAFIKAVEDGRATYMSGLNDLVRGVARPRRAETLCRVLPRGRLDNWVGKLAVVGSSPGGRGVVAIEVAPKLVFATNRTEASDDKDKTLIDVRSPLFAAAAVLAVGDRVVFSGTLLPGGDDCFKEVGKDVAATMSAPEFTLRLDGIRKVVPPAANAVLSGAAKPMSIAQSSDYVRDSVDIIAGGVACGADSRRVFALIIKVLIKATAGQSTDQRDALIGLMFTPPSTSAQNKENCESKSSALDRLEAEAS